MKNLLLCAIVLTLLTACETMQGLGRDLQKGGSNIEDAAESLTP